MFSISSISKKIVIILLLIFIVLLFSKRKTLAHPIISNANDVSFTVSWISAASAIGEVRYGPTSSLGSTSYDIRGKNYSGNIHFVIISDLQPETTYYFDVVTGTSIDNNGGLHYSFITGPTSDTPPESDTAFGLVTLSDGSTPANEAIAYITIKDDDGQGSSGRSTTLSSLVESGYWDVQLANTRLLDMSEPFDYSLSGDILEISIYAPDGSTAKASTFTGNARPAPQIQTNDICIKEVCDFIDNDCDTLVDERDAQGCTVFYKDQDGDGYGVTFDSLCLCDQEAYYRAGQGGDPDDEDPFVIPFVVNMEIAAGWSMISLPLIPDNPKLSILFPDAVVVYSYKKDVGYKRVKEDEDLLPGAGYWILLDQNQSYQLIGQELTNYNFSVENGWYMIGGCSDAAQASVNPGNIAETFIYVPGFGYQQIQETDNLEASNGYWILFRDINDQAELTVESIIP